MGNRADWQEVRPLGGGGQSHVFLVRTPERVAEREAFLQRIQRHAGTSNPEGAAEVLDYWSE